jgi:hypothetical protein
VGGHSYIHKIENQDFLPSPKIIEKIAKELKSPFLGKAIFRSQKYRTQQKIAKATKKSSQNKN